jgi:hypothetical protein
MVLADAEMCLALEVVTKFEMGLYKTEENDVKFAHDYQVSHGRLDSLGVRAIIKGIV